MTEKFLTPEQVCEMVPGLTKHSLARMRWQGNGPAYVRVTPRKVIYALGSIEQFLSARQETRTDQRASA